MNIVILNGNTGQEIKTHEFDDGGKVGNLSLATDESYTKKSGERVNRSEWHNLVFRNKSVDIIDKYVPKGSKLTIRGKIRTRKFQDKSGEDKYMTEIIVQEFDLPPKQNSSPSVNNSNNSDFIPQKDEKEDDLPF